MSHLCENAVQGVLNPECYGLSGPSNCDFLGLKWTSNNVDKSKNLYLIGRKMSKMS